MNYLKLSLGVILILSISRFIPHPPNFTSLIALSFYVPAVFGLKFLPIVLIAFIFTDLIIGFHSVVLYSWGSVLLISLISIYFNKSIFFRIFGCITGAFIFYLITNFGVWINGYHGTMQIGIIENYIIALPFFGNTLISTIIYSVLIETIYYFYKTNKKIRN